MRYKLSPGTFQPEGEESLITSDVLEQEQGQESAVYIGDNFEFSPKLSFYAGVRYSFYQSLGPRDVYTYPATGSKEESNIQDTVSYSAGKPRLPPWAEAEIFNSIQPYGQMSLQIQL